MGGEGQQRRFLDLLPLAGNGVAPADDTGFQFVTGEIGSGERNDLNAPVQKTL